MSSFLTSFLGVFPSYFMVVSTIASIAFIHSSRVCVCLVQSRRKSTKKQKDQTNKPKTPTQNNPAVAAHQLQYLCVANEGAHRRASDFPSYFILMSSRTPPPHAAPAHAEKQRQHTSLCYMSRGGWPPFRPPTHFVQHSSGGRGPPKHAAAPHPHSARLDLGC